MKQAARAKTGRRKPAASKAGDVVVRKATKGDIPAIAALNIGMMRFHEARDRTFKVAPGAKAKLAAHKARQLRRRDTRLTVAEENGKVIAYCLSLVTARPPIYTERRAVSIIDMCVSARCRRRGIGHFLFEDAMKWARSRRIKRMEVSFASSNEISSRFWPGLGFATFVERAYLEI